MKFSIARALGIADKRTGFDWSVLVVLCAVTVLTNVLLSDQGCMAEAADPERPRLSDRCLLRVVPAMILLILALIFQFQRLVGKCT